MTADDFTETANAAAREYASTPRMNVGTVRDRIAVAHMAGAEWARTHLITQEESVLMNSREETISDRLSDAGYTEYAEDEDGGVTWVSAPLSEVLRIVSAAQEPTNAEVEAAAQELWKHRARGTIHPHYRWDRLAPELRQSLRELARACLSAARAARRDEEKR